MATFWKLSYTPFHIYCINWFIFIKHPKQDNYNPLILANALHSPVFRYLLCCPDYLISNPAFKTSCWITSWLLFFFFKSSVTIPACNAIHIEVHTCKLGTGVKLRYKMLVTLPAASLVLLMGRIRYRFVVDFVALIPLSLNIYINCDMRFP